MGKFLRKVDRTLRPDVYDTTVSKFYSDLPEGKETTLTARAGIMKDAIIMDFPVPPTPSYGEGELSGFKFEFSQDEANLTGVTYAAPFAIYMMREGHELGNEEGVANRVKDSTHQIYAPAAVISVYHQEADKDPQSMYVEKFNNANPDEIVHHTPGSSTISSFSYITEEDWETYWKGDKWYGSIQLSQGGAYNSSNGFSSIHPITGEKIIRVEPVTDGAGDWKTVNTANLGRGASGTKKWGDVGQLYMYETNGYFDRKIGGSGIGGKIKHFNHEILTDIADEKNTFHEATTTDTFFDVINTNPNYIKPDKEDLKDGDADYQWADSETNFLAYTGVNFSTQHAKTEGMSLQMKAFMDTNVLLGATTARDEASMPMDRGSTNHAFDTGHRRQSICIAKKNIPQPVTYFDEYLSDSKNRTSGTWQTPQEIDIDVYFDELGTVYAYKSDDSTQANCPHAASASEYNNYTSPGYVYTHLRSFAIIFSDKTPEDSQDFGDFVHQHCSAQDADKDLGDVSDVSDNIMGVMFYKIPSGATQNIDNNQIMIKTLSGHGSGAPTDNVDNVILDNETVHQSFIEPHNKAVLGWKTDSTPTGYRLKEKTWYRLKFIYNINGKNGTQEQNDGDAAGGNMSLFIFDPATNELMNNMNQGAYTNNPYVSPIIIKNCNAAGSDFVNNGPAKWPSNLSLWVNNIGPQWFSTVHSSSEWATGADPGAGAVSAKEDLFYETAVTLNATQGQRQNFPYVPQYTKTEVFIDKITFRNQNLLHANMGGDNNPHYVSNAGCIVSNNKQMFSPSTLKPNPNLSVGPTGIALGFNDRTQLNGVDKWLLFNGFATSNENETSALTDGNIHCGVMTNATPSLMGDHIDMGSESTDFFLTAAIGADATDIKTGDGVLADPLQDVDGFSQKGLVKITSSAVTWDNVNDRRENLWASARVLYADKLSASAGEIVVDDPSVLSMPEGTEFKIYKVYEANSTASASAIVNIGKIDGNVVTIYASSGSNIYDLMSDTTDGTNTISQVFISPYMYWINIMTSGGGSLPERKYESVCLLDDDLATTTGGTGLGATWNESSFASSSGVTNYTQLRNLFIDNTPAYDTEVDYGFGIYSENQTGYVTQFVPSLDTNVIDLGRVQDVRNFEENDRFSFIIKSTSESSLDYRMVINSSDHATQTKRPALYAEYDDEIPKITDFKVSPNEDNAQHIDFEWNIEGDDAWYGLLFIDNKEITSQYHNAIAHIPLDEDNATKMYLYYPNKGDSYVERTGASSELLGSVTATIRAERDGLAGWSKRFDNSNAKLTFACSTDLTDCTDEMTLVTHCIPDYDTSSGTRYIFYRTNFISLSLESSTDGTYVKAIVTNSNDDTYTLKSPYVLTDGDTPLSIILTYDKKLSANGFKLFVNGIISDSVDIGDYNVKATDNVVTIGNDASGDGFNGRIEEVVLYNQAVHVVSPSQQKYTHTMPLSKGEINSEVNSGTGAPQNYMARLFVKDYHNLRGYSINEVASSHGISLSKTSFALNDT